MEKPLAFVIEDDPDVAELYTHMLNLLGFRCEAISQGETAQDRVRAAVPALVILDLHLSHQVDGRMLLDQMKDDPRYQNTPVIVISGYPRMAEGLYDKADVVLIKPVDMRQLGSLIARIQNKITGHSFSALSAFKNRILAPETFLERLQVNLNRARSREEHIFALIAVSMSIREAPGGASLPEAKRAELFDEAMLRLMWRLRSPDLCTRIGESTFCVMLYEMGDRADVTAVVQRMTDSIREPFRIGSLDVRLSSRMGVALSAEGCADADAMLKACLQAARSPGAQVV